MTLTEEQEKHHQELLRSISKGEELLKAKPGVHGMSEHLQNLASFLSYTPRMVEISSAIYSWAKGQAAEEAMNNEVILAAKQNIQMKWIEGKIAKYGALYDKTERLKKSIDSAIDAYRSLLSYEKEQMRNAT